ncbi:hypothetical protein WICPIJ_008645 [Wickerhamomyces pijperi]|uniref:Potassium transport protein n=1 Tax=Wickerhamomyces pijperi TaxID=599730 RepID=A0A9P8PVV8_WICPI|nr:hypothetical protein WICPIJ_008645 [Wickerhamomyces pijperi]
MAIKFIDATRPRTKLNAESQPNHDTSPSSSEDAAETANEGDINQEPVLHAPSISLFHIDKTIGWRIRDFVASCEEKLGPYLKWLFPSFIAVHYFYVIMMVIVCSVMIYPVKNMAYIDALFFAAGASTQAGLNTIDVNNISLYQQVVIYIVCCLTTPIFIHGSLCFLRLYWFERYFDNIRSSSKLNFKMRRAATLMERQRTMDRQKTAESSGVQTKNSKPSRTFNSKFNFGFSKGESHNHSIEQEQVHPKQVTQAQNDNRQDALSPKEDMSSTSSYDTNMASHGPGSESTPPRENTESLALDDLSSLDTEDTEDDNGSRVNKGITFARDMPKPSRERQEVTPRDMYVSISMLRNQNIDQADLSHLEHPSPSYDDHRHQIGQNSTMGENTEDFDEDEGPTLIIRGPAEREIQFEEPSIRKKTNHKSQRSLKKSLQGASRSQDELSEHDKQTHSHPESSSGVSRIHRTQSNLQPTRENEPDIGFVQRRSKTMNHTSTGSGNSSRDQSAWLFDIQKMKKSIKRRMSSNAVNNDDSVMLGSDLECEHDTNSNSEEADEDEEEADDISPYGLQRTMSTNYLSWVPQVGRNSTFVNLTDQQKEELGGVEYRALKVLVKILITYYVGFHVLAAVLLVPWIWKRSYFREVVNSYAIETSWWGIFTGMTSFNDLGITLTPNSMSSFNTSPYALLVTAFFVIIGNTGFPIFLRFIIWVMFKVSHDLSLMKESLGFLLDHPRRCFTLLFPSAPTWWLFFILLVLNIIDLILFIVLDLNAQVLSSLTTAQKILDGFFQAVSTRTAGFTCVDLSQLHPSVQVSYMVMMYISVLPIAISIRRTNVYEEQSLGIFAVTAQGHLRRSSTMVNQEDHDNPENEHTNATSFIGAHLRKQLSFDLWFIVMGVFIICIAEGPKIQDPKSTDFDIWHILFEVVSAYGTVGLSLGFPGTNASFSAQFNVVSKLVIILMMIRGRHRGLPYSLDRAIMLPSKQMDRRDKVQDLHNRVDSLDLERQGHAQTMDTLHSNANHDPVLQFFKSVTPDPIRKHIRRPSVFGRNSVSSSSKMSRKHSIGGKSVAHAFLKTPTEENRDNGLFNTVGNSMNEDPNTRRERRTNATENDDYFGAIHFNHNRPRAMNSTDYELDNLQLTRERQGTVDKPLDLRTYETNPEASNEQNQSGSEYENPIFRIDSHRSV